MRMLPTTALFAMSFLVTAVSSTQAEQQFPDATETVPELIDLYTQSDSGCRLVRSKDVKVVVKCLARFVYGAALNERGWCIGKKGQANAQMKWHECQSDSMRFPPLDLPKL